MDRLPLFSPRQLVALWVYLTRPAASYDIELRRKSRVLSGMLVVLIPLCLIGSFYPLSEDSSQPIGEDIEFYIPLAAALAFSLAYGLNRRGSYYRAVALTLIIVSLATFAAAVPDNSSDDLLVLIYLVIPMAASSLFLSIPDTVRFTAANLAGLIVFGLLVNRASVADMFWGLFLFLTAAAVVILLVSYYRRRLEIDRQAELAARERQLRLLTDNMVDIVVQADAQDIVRYVSPSVMNVLGYAPEDFIGQPVEQAWLVLVHPEDRDDVRETYEHAVEQQRVRKIEYRIRHGGGYHVWVESTGKPVSLASSASTGLIFVTRDITERRQAEKAVRESEEHYRQTVENSPNLIFAVSPDGLIRQWNRACEIVLGYGADIIGQSYHRLLWDTEDAAALDELVGRVSENQSFQGIEIAYRCKHGEIRHTMSRLYPLLNVGGEVESIVFANTDVTRRKQLDEELKQQKELLQTIFDHIPMLIVFYDSKQEIRMVNRALERTFGWTFEEIQRTNIFEDLFPEPIVRLAHYEHMLAASGEWRDFPTRTRDGRVIETSWATIRLSDSSSIGIGQNISSRKQTEEKLRISEERLRAAVESSLDAFFILDSLRNESGQIEDFVFIDMNENAEEMLGMPRSDLVGKGLCEMFPVNRTAGFFDKYVRVVETGRPLEEEFQLDNLETDPNSIAGWYHHQIVPLSDGIAITTRDITARKQTEEALLRERTLLRTLIDTLPEYVYVKDTQHRIIAANKAYIQRQGAVREEEVLGKTDADYWPEAAEQYHADERLVFETGTPMIDRESLYVDESGQQFWSLTSKVPFYDRAGRIAGLVGVTRSITARKQMEEALRASEERYRSLMEMLPLLVGVTDLDGRFLYMNRAGAALCGVAHPDAIVGHDSREFIAPESLDMWNAGLERIRQYSEARLTPQVEYTILQPGGQRVEIEAHALPILYQGQPALLGVAQDITERKRAAMRQFELTLERERVKLLQQLIGYISHDLRNPLASMRVRYDLLRRVTDPERQQQQIERLGEQLIHLEQQVMNLLTITRLDQTDPSDLPFESLDLNLLIEHTIAEQAPLINAHKHQVILSSDRNLPFVPAVRDEIERVVRHLLVNAVNYTPAGGNIALKTCQQGDTVCFAVEDNGIGIGVVDLPHIFDPFFRADPARGIDQGGMGLGLTIARRIIEAHGGSIEVESEPGKYTRFTVRLPLRRPMPD